VSDVADPLAGTAIPDGSRLVDQQPLDVAPAGPNARLQPYSIGLW
jgi:hypothetical protein